MLRPLMYLFFLLFSFTGFSQTYSYSFSGTLDDSGLSKLEKEIRKLNFAEKIKINYKQEKKAGEILLFHHGSLSEGDNNSEASPIDLKNTLIANGLVPGSFKEIKK